MHSSLTIETIAVGEIDLTMKFTRWKSANVEAYIWEQANTGLIQVRVRGAQQPDVPCESGSQYEFKTYFCALDWSLRIPTSNRTWSAKVVFAQNYHGFGPRRMVRISGCGEGMPSTQHIPVILTPWRRGNVLGQRHTTTTAGENRR